MAGLVMRTCSRSLLYSQQWGHRLPGVRYLLSDEFLKQNQFLKDKQATLFFFRKEKDNFFDTMNVKLLNSENIAERELKSLIYLSDSESDVQLTKKCLLRYSENAGPTSYKCGPLFLRLCRNLKMVDAAIDVLTDEATKEKLRDYTSYNILLDLLYTECQYEKAFEILEQMETQGFNLNRETLILAFAICFKLNNPRSLEKSIKIFEKAESKDIRPPRLALCFFSALALKQGDFITAYRAYNKIERKDSTIPCNLAVLIAAEQKDEQKILDTLETASKPAVYNFLQKNVFSKEVMDVAENLLKPTDSFEKFKELSEKLQQSGLITDLTLDEIIHHFQEIDQRAFVRRKTQARDRLGNDQSREKRHSKKSDQISLSEAN
ncbi:pentatricopeptide repeat-containing protein 2, mitochondrial [Mantella aurantiaca]